MSHYYSKTQKSPLRIKKITLKLLGNSFEFLTAGGVFSRGRLDKGTELLINNAIIKKGKILDLGCGYGILGLVLAKAHPEIEVVMSDVNNRAVSLAKKNIKLNRLDNAKALQSDNFEKIKESFDVILLNPPQSAGKKICFEMIDQSKEHLNKGGTLQVVVRRKKGGKIISEHMKQTFGNIKEIKKGSGYGVFVSKK